jgi:hypothetical protein
MYRFRISQAYGLEVFIATRLQKHLQTNITVSQIRGKNKTTEVTKNLTRFNPGLPGFRKFSKKSFDGPAAFC